jgi:hypothetical protein
MYVIIKYVPNRKNVLMPVILITGTEVMEFNSLEEAEKMKVIFESNSDSGYKYEVKKI